MTKYSSFDRREKPRLRIPARLTLSALSGGNSFVGDVLNLSQDGVCFKSDAPLSLIKKYSVEIIVEGKLHIKTVANLMWSKNENGSILYGLSFFQLPFDDQKQLSDLFDGAQLTNPVMMEDRRKTNRRYSASSNILSGMDHRRIERRNSIRLQERKGVQARFLTTELKGLLFRRVAITGLGIVSPIGNGKDAFLNSLKSGVTGIRPLTCFDTTDFPCKLGGQIQNLNIEDYLPSKRAKQMDFATQIGLISAIMAVNDANLHPKHENRRRIGVGMGTTMGGLGWVFDQYAGYQKHGVKEIHPYTIAAGSPNACSGEIAAEFKLRGPCVTFSQGCTSSASAISYAYEQVRSSTADIMIAGGCEAPFVLPIYAAFSRSGLMCETNGSSSALPKPFSKNRGGIILAEGAAVLVIEDWEHAMARRAHIYAEIVGSANTCDGFDMILPSIDGVEATRAIDIALSEAGIAKEQVDVIFTHAPGSREADKIEMKALRRAFGSHLSHVPIANIKSMVGYPQGATSAIECVAACLAMQNGFIPPVVGVENPEIALNVSTKTRNAELHTALIDCFGFGGKNICLALSRS